jgi:8-hydroxy-5-deazaflavin:NADPH oxidoreductase
MKIAVLGTGMVGQTIANKLNSLNHEVYMGTRNSQETLSRTKPNQMTGKSFTDWFKDNSSVKLIDLDKLPADIELFVNATNGHGTIDTLESIGNKKLNGKIILDIANPLDFSKGMPPSLFISNTDSLGEQIQREFPESKVVKSLNTMNAYLMADPALVPGDHNVFMSGNDKAAKETVESLLSSFGWKKQNIIDLGDITTARGTEMLLPIWIRLMGTLGTVEFNFNIVRK